MSVDDDINAGNIPAAKTSPYAETVPAQLIVCAKTANFSNKSIISEHIAVTVQVKV